jgi:hypothetical protein
MSIRFGESQLQVLFIIEFVNKMNNNRIQPIVPTTNQEKLLPWDVGFNLPDIGQPNIDQMGCNLFLQFKRSALIRTSRGAHWRRWGQSYFRFDMAHIKLNKCTGRKEMNYDQYDILKDIQAEGYPAFYVTNHTDDFNELMRWAVSGCIIDECPAFHLGYITERHKSATFLRGADRCIMESKPEEMLSKGWEELVKIIKDSPRTSMRQDLAIFPKIFGTSKLIKEEYYQRGNTNDPMNNWLELRRLLYKNTDIVWWKLNIPD